MKTIYRPFIKGVNWVFVGLIGVFVFACSNEDDPCSSYNSYGSYGGSYGSYGGLYEGVYDPECADDRTNDNLKSEEALDNSHIRMDSTDVSFLLPE